MPLDRDPAGGVDGPGGVEGDLPAETVRVGEVAGVAAPWLGLGRRHDDGASGLRLAHRLVYLLGTAHVVAQGDAGDTGGGVGPRLARHLAVDRPAEALGIETA